MTRETKIGLIIAGSFLCLVCIVVASKLRRGDVPPQDAEEQSVTIVPNHGNDMSKGTGKVNPPDGKRNGQSEKGGATQPAGPPPVAIRSDNAGKQPLKINPPQATSDKVELDLAHQMELANKTKPLPQLPQSDPAQTLKAPGFPDLPPLPATPQNKAVPEKSSNIVQGAPALPDSALPLPLAPVGGVPAPMLDTFGQLNTSGNPGGPAGVPGPIPDFPKKLEQGVASPANPKKEQQVMAPTDPGKPFPPLPGPGENKEKFQPPALEVKPPIQSGVLPPNGGMVEVPVPAPLQPGFPVSPLPEFPKQNPKEAPKSGLPSDPAPTPLPKQYEPPAAPQFQPQPVTDPKQAPMPLPIIPKQEGQSIPPITSIPGPDPRPLPSIPPAGNGKPAGVVMRSADQYVCKPGETSFATLSKKFYDSEKYADALLEYNRAHRIALPNGENFMVPNPFLNSGQAVFVPTKSKLESDFRSLIRDEPNQLAPIVKNAPPVITAPISIGGPPPMVQTPAPVKLAPPAPLMSTVPTPNQAVIPAQGTPTSDPTRNYTVQNPRGENILDIAERVLGDRNEWHKIYRINPNYRPENIIPAGSTLRIPVN